MVPSEYDMLRSCSILMGNIYLAMEVGGEVIVLECDLLNAWQLLSKSMPSSCGVERRELGVKGS